MLDEPTNHLDMRTIDWLARHLRERWADGAGALLVVTHDRWFLDEVCTSMWEVHDGRVDPLDLLALRKNLSGTYDIAPFA